MNWKGKGTNAERDIIKKFWEAEGWAAHRIAGSGSNRYPSPDIIAGCRTRKLAIEAKTTSKNRQYLTAEEISGLKEFCRIFAAEPWIAVKFPKTDWLFLCIEDLEDSGKNHAIGLELGKLRGVSFEELIRDVGTLSSAEREQDKYSEIEHTER